MAYQKTPCFSKFWYGFLNCLEIKKNIVQLVGSDNSMVGFYSHLVPNPATRDPHSFVAGNGSS